MIGHPNAAASTVCIEQWINLRWERATPALRHSPRAGPLWRLVHHAHQRSMWICARSRRRRAGRFTRASARDLSGHSSAPNPAPIN